MKTLLLFISFLLIASTINAGPFEPKARSYKTTSFKKHRKPKGKDAFACVRHKKVNRKGLMR